MKNMNTFLWMGTIGLIATGIGYLLTTSQTQEWLIPQFITWFSFIIIGIIKAILNRKKNNDEQQK